MQLHQLRRLIREGFNAPIIELFQLWASDPVVARRVSSRWEEADDKVRRCFTSYLNSIKRY